jgi:prophage regulatory protein
LSAPVRILRKRRVAEVTGLPVPTIYRLMSLGNFPEPVSLSERTVGWIEAEIQEWLQARVAERDRAMKHAS